MDVTELLAVYTAVFAGFASALHEQGYIDARLLAETLRPRCPLSNQGELFVEGIQRAIITAIEAREARASGPKLVS